MHRYEHIYEPSDDSFMLAKILPRYAKGKVLDMGTGSGILAETAAKSKKVKSVLAVDVNPHALKYVDSLDRKVKPYRKKIETRKSNLFSKVDKKFNVIIFNPPYLPEDKRLPRDVLEKAFAGGKHGWETIAKFMENVPNHLDKKGVILLLFSSLTKKEKVEELISNRLFDYKELKKKKIFHETLYIYKVERNKLREELEKKGISNISKYAHGRRGEVYRGEYNGRKVAIKVQKTPGNKHIKNEIKWLKKVNKHKIGPKYLFSSTKYFVMELIEGKLIFDYMRDNGKTEIRKLLKKVFEQCHKLDTMGVNKLEMHHPHKHIIVRKDNNPVLIDFERCALNKKPKNVTQFSQFVTSTNFQFSIANKNFWINNDKLRRFAAMYKNNMNLKNLDKILKEIR
jgi:release factor glutamine methyltransferase